MVGTTKTRAAVAHRRSVSVGRQVRVLIGAPQRMLRQALIAALTEHPRLRVVGDVDDGKEAVRWALEVLPDITLLDEGLSRIGGTHAATVLHYEVPELRVVTLTDVGPGTSEATAPEEAVAARVSKQLGTDALADVLLRVAAGERPGDVAAPPPPVQDRPKPSSGSQRLRASERVLLELLVEGDDNRLMAERLGCTEKTVRNRLSELYHKLHLRNRTQAALYAVRIGLVDPGGVGRG